ncbi:MAG: redox-sensing transcriptional repressor Rex [Candidatus Omnitrophota bacterium]
MKTKKTSKRKNFSPETISRLSLYLRNFKLLRDTGTLTISSDKVAQFLNVTPEQFRKDLSFFGGFGKRGVGYNVERLVSELESILGVNKEWRIAVVGIGSLGSALLGFGGFTKFNIKITHAFDVSKDKIGKRRAGIKIDDVKRLKATIKKHKIRIVIISTPASAAQEIADELVSSGIRGILNFAPTALKIPGHVSVSNVDMACELERLIFFAKKQIMAR